MTGPEHYGYAEELLEMAGDDETGSDIERYHLAKAQVHATLALAAAHALMGEATDQAWWKVAAPQEATP